MERVSMRKIRELLRLKFESGLSARRIAESLQMARSTVGEYERRFVDSGLPWPSGDTGHAHLRDINARLCPNPLKSPYRIP
jgi:transcriptional regulator with XRE-family HTH domain